MNLLRTSALLGFGGALLCTGAADAAYCGPYSEEYTNPNFQMPPGTITYRIYAYFDNDSDQLLGIGSAPDQPWELVSPTGFFQEDSFGGWWAHYGPLDVPFDYLYLHYDSYWTIGTDDSGAGAELGLYYYERGWEMRWEEKQWYADGCGIFRMPDDPLTYPDDGKVLLGQFTLPIPPPPKEACLVGRLRMHMISDGQPMTVDEWIWVPLPAPAPAPGSLAVLGLAGLIRRTRRR